MASRWGLIPARGGSKGVIRKNSRIVNGKPLIAYTIEAALQSKLLDGLVVSTDDQEIAEIARHYGAQVPFLRPPDLASDVSSDLDVISHFNDWLQQSNYAPDIIAYLRPTTPFKTAEIIDQSIQTLLNNLALSGVRSVTKSEGALHPYWMFTETELKLQPFIEGVTLEKYYQRQLLPPCYRLNGVCDVFKVQNLASGTLYGDSIGFVEVAESQSLDIDTELDLQFFEFLLTKQYGKEL